MTTAMRRDNGHQADHKEQGETDLLTHVERLRANVPAVLQLYSHWVVWRWEERTGGGKPAKIPYRPHAPWGAASKRAAVNIPSHWGTFKQALESLRRGSFSGIGFVFHESDPFLGIDLDHCLDLAGQLTEFARRTLLDMESYSEWSPSREGLHILVEASIPTAVKRSSLEMYGTRRFFTISGLRVENTLASIQPRQEPVDALYRRFMRTKEGDNLSKGTLSTPSVGAVEPAPETRLSGRTADDLSDAELLRRAMSSAGPHGAAFARLWRGDKSGCVHQTGERQGEIDDSLADLVLCGMLAFWTGKNPLRMDHLFRQSGLMRSKWDRRARSGQTYGEGTIALAIARCRAAYDPNWSTAAAREHTNVHSSLQTQHDEERDKER